MIETCASNLLDDLPAAMSLDASCDDEMPRDVGVSFPLAKTEIFRELVIFLAKVYRLIYFAIIIYAIGPFAAVGVGLMFFVLALRRCPDEQADQVVFDPEACLRTICFSRQSI